MNCTVIDGWDICGDNIGDAMRNAKVLDIALQDQLYDKLTKLQPRPSIYDSDFIAANQVMQKKKIKISLYLLDICSYFQ